MPTTEQDLRAELTAALMEHTPDNVGSARVARIVDDVWPVIIAALRTGWTVNGEPESWRQRAERAQVELDRTRALAEILTDLDRCEHGRHEGDDCTFPDGGCAGKIAGARSMGNAYAERGTRRIGTFMDGTPIVVPAKATNNPQAWHG